MMSNSNPPVVRSAKSVAEAEDVDVAGVENLRVRVIRVELGDEGGNVGDGRGVTVVLAVERKANATTMASIMATP
jgi:hypothetical protein